MNTIQLELSCSTIYRYPPETVWTALTDRQALRTWFLDTDFEAQVGKAFSVRGPHLGVVNCVVLVLDPPCRMEWSWQSPEFVTPTTVVFMLEKVQEGTRLTVKHVGSAPQVHQTDTTRGWPGRLNRLSRWLDGSFIASVSVEKIANGRPFADQDWKNEHAALKEGEHRMSVLTVQSKDREQVIDITDDVAALAASMRDGVCSLFTQHTTCALTVLTDEEGIAEDFLNVLRGLVPQTQTYVHDSADHVRAHVLSALVGPSVSVPVREGRLGLGQFQHIVLVEFEGPRPRTIEVDGALIPSRSET